MESQRAAFGLFVVACCLYGRLGGGSREARRCSTGTPTLVSAARPDWCWMGGSIPSTGAEIMSNAHTSHQSVTAGMSFYSSNDTPHLFYVRDGIKINEAILKACTTTRCALLRLNEIDPMKKLVIEDYLTIKYLMEMSDALLFAVHEGLQSAQSA
jgi:hypothetical protein